MRTPFTGNPVHTHHKLKGMLFFSSQLQVIGGINIERIIIYRFILIADLTSSRTRTVIIFFYRETVCRHTSRVYSFALFIDKDLTAVLYPRRRRIPCSTGLVLGYRRICFRSLSVVSIIKFNIPILRNIQCKTQVNVIIFILQIICIWCSHFIRRLFQRIAMFCHSHRKQWAPTIHIQPRVSRSITNTRITFITVGIDRTGSHCKIFIQFRCYTDRCIISFEVVLLGSLRHTTLIQIPQSYIITGLAAFTIYR